MWRMCAWLFTRRCRLPALRLRNSAVSKTGPRSARRKTNPSSRSRKTKASCHPVLFAPNTSWRKPDRRPPPFPEDSRPARRHVPSPAPHRQPLCPVDRQRGRQVWVHKECPRPLRLRRRRHKARRRRKYFPHQEARVPAEILCHRPLVCRHPVDPRVSALPLGGHLPLARPTQIFRLYP